MALSAIPCAGADVQTPAKDDPAALFAAFSEAWKAREQGGAGQIADKLVHLRERARPVMPQLLDFIHELPPEKHVEGTEFSYRTDAAEVLASIGAPAALALADVISEGDAKVSEPVTYVVPGGTSVMGSKSYVAADAEYYPSAISFSRFETIAEAFDRLAIEALPAVPQLVKLLDSPSAEIRAQACRCLGPIGPLASAALGRIRALCKDPDARCRKEALHAFALLETDSAQLVPLLADALADKSAEVRREALRLIPVIGKPAVPLADSLVALLAAAELDPMELHGAEQRLFAPRPGDLETGQIIAALETIGLQNGKQCDLLGDLLVRGQGRMNPEFRRMIGALLSSAGTMAHPALERWVSSTEDADDGTQIAALAAAARVKPSIEKLVPAIIDRSLALGRKLIPPRTDSYSDVTRKIPPLEFAAYQLLGLMPRLGSGAALHFSKIDGRDEVTRNFAIANVDKLQGSDLTPAIAWLIERLADKDEKLRRFVATSLGRIGPRASAAVPALQAIVDGFAYTRYNEDESQVDFVQQCYLALARITGEPERWITQSEERLLRPMLAEQPRQQQRSIVGYLVMITQIGPPAVPHLGRWMSGGDASLASDTMDTVIVAGSFDPAMAVAALPEILKNRRHFEVDRHYMFAQFVSNAGPAGAGALDILLGCIEKYRRQTTDPAEREKLGHSWSRYTYGADDRIAELLAAFRAIGPAGAQNAVPALLALYDEEPMKSATFSRHVSVRSDMLDTLNTLRADLRPMAEKWAPRLAEPLETEFEVDGSIRELGAYGNLAKSAVPELIRYARLRRSHRKDALDALHRIAPDDARIRALRHVARFDPE